MSRPVTIDADRLRELGAIFAIGYDAFERAWHVSITGGAVTIEVADADPDAAVRTAFAKLGEQPAPAKNDEPFG